VKLKLCNSFVHTLYKYGHTKLILVHDILFSGVKTPPAYTAGRVIMKYMGEATQFLTFPTTHTECDGS
jgi:hypothetical protein